MLLLVASRNACCPLKLLARWTFLPDEEVQQDQKL